MYIHQGMGEFIGFEVVRNGHSGFLECWDFCVWKCLGIVVVMLDSGNARMMYSVLGDIYI